MHNIKFMYKKKKNEIYLFENYENKINLFKYIHIFIFIFL